MLEEPCITVRSGKGKGKESLPLTKEEIKAALNPSEPLFSHLETEQFQLDGSPTAQSAQNF